MLPRTVALPDLRDVFLANEGYVLRSLRRLGVPERDVEDVAHEVFLLVHARLSDLDPSRPIRPWLFAFCFRVASNYRRKSARAPVQELEEILDEAPSVSDKLEDEERRLLVLEALETLDLERRAVFVLHCLDDVPIPVVAETLSIPLGTAYTRLRAGKQAFTEAVRRLGKRRGLR